jgi:mono/diheme cytochrome c family protein
MGAGLFETQCASCHGEHGEGRGNVPAIMGPGALRRQPPVDTLSQTTNAGSDGQRGALRPPSPDQGRPEFVTAASLHSYLVYHMPKIERQPMTEADYWAVVQFMLIAHGSEVPEEGVSAANGARIAIATPE